MIWKKMYIIIGEFKDKEGNLKIKKIKDMLKKKIMRE